MVAFLSNDAKMIDAFKHNRDIYATIAALSFNSTYEECLEFNPITGENQPEGKERRSQAKKIVLGILYGRSIPSIGQQLFGGRTDMTEKEMTDAAQTIYDSVLNAFPNLRAFMEYSQNCARQYGYVETILGRRRHIPGMQLPRFEYVPTSKYVNPDIDPLDPRTLKHKNEIPTRIVKKLDTELHSYKYKGQVYKRVKQLLEDEHIKVIIHDNDIQKASRKCVNSQVQGCLSGDVRIQTKEFGIVKLQDYVGSTLTMWDGDMWSSGTITYSGKKQKCILTFNSGQSIVCSPTHKFLTINTRGNKHFKELNHLQVGDRIVLNPNFTDSDYVYSSKWAEVELFANNAKYHYLDMVDDKFTLGVFLGRLASDGSYQMRDDGGCSLRQLIAEHEFNILPTLETVSAVWGGHTKINEVRQNRNQRMAQIDVSSKSLVNEIVKLDIKHSLHDNIFMDTRLLRGFLSGFYDGDGSISEDTCIKLVFGTQFDFKPFLNDLQKALSFLGISSYQHQYKDRSVLSVRKCDTSKFCKLVGFVNSNKHKKATQVTPKKDNHTFGCSFMIVKDINITDEYIDMYDVCNTNNGYFIADGLVTHNSAAELTKIALLKVFNNPEWNAIGGRILVPVHDEFIAEVPMDNWKRGGEILSQLMSEAGSFLPFTISCDVTTTLRWYGLSYPCIYTEPDVSDDLSSDLPADKISWIQYHLFELEYELPKFKNPDGKKLEGDAALGVNGIWSDELSNAITDYIQRYQITKEQFVEHIKNKVVYDLQI